MFHQIHQNSIYSFILFFLFKNSFASNDLVRDLYLSIFITTYSVGSITIFYKYNVDFFESAWQGLKIKTPFARPFFTDLI